MLTLEACLHLLKLVRIAEMAFSCLYPQKHSLDANLTHCDGGFFIINAADKVSHYPELASIVVNAMANL
jgi:hypothetical protein